MVTEPEANYIFNTVLHVLILFTFLNVFFFTFASKLISKSIQKELDGIIDKQVYKILDQLDTMEKRLGVDGVVFNWSEIDKLAKKIESNAQGVLPEIVKSNARLKKLGLGIIISILILLILIYVYFRVINGYHINLKEIIAENIIIFGFVALLEFIFFTKIASKFIPVTPNFVSMSILERIKYRLNLAVLGPKEDNS